MRGCLKEPASNVGDEEWMEPGYILKLEPTYFNKGLDLKYERRGFKANSKF